MPFTSTLSIDEIKVGMSASYSQTISDADVKSFAGISGDNNPFHMSDEFASSSRFKKRISHELLSASFFSALFGTKLPGSGYVYIFQNLNFKRPVYLGDTVTAIADERIRGGGETICNVSGKQVIFGTAKLFIPN